MLDINELLCDCLYFSSNKLARVIGKIADEEFRITGLSPAYIYLISVVGKKEGITQKELGEVLCIAPSTITRFIDKLENKGLLRRQNEGKKSFIYLTAKGKDLQPDINIAWGNLHSRYLEAIGEEEYKKLITVINSACDKMEKK
ncbi:transcriptional regulator, MarR family [Clostridium sp. DL-VIII]|uniref:MarR family winged helix-turn-helix transcriptional regulator n=1 Tax=Clostridium sp. DL-VIII TaxID=641107 RepID=UPI00023AF7FD|nr:MarR family transcriptional regulator [Clostridium sp. DL-VIII]EHI96885.1 transcriptional regulator, MarR family [Clostridium sp. DL-VIII]